jgi:hypothetical protein
MRVLILTLLILPLFLIPEISSAAPLVPCNGPDCGTCELVKLGNNIITWLVSVMAVICALMIVFAGFKMVTSAGNSGEISKAKEMIANTLIGFVILLAAWLIIDTVMKMFVNQSVVGPWNQIECILATTPAGAPAGTGTVTVTPTPGACTVPALSPITDAEALQMEGGATVIWPTNTQLKACASKFIGTVGGSVTSAYRPQSYQTHLYEIRDRWCTQGLQSNIDSACSQIRSSVAGEVSKHFGSGWSCGAVAATNSTHGSGTGVDISGINQSSPTVIAAATASCLTWNNYSGDPYHYTLRSGCTCN